LIFLLILMLFIFFLLSLDCIYVNIILILTDFALEIVATNANPFSIVTGLKR